MKYVIIIGAGPAGLTSGLEFLCRTDIKPIILEADDCLGGISRTVNYRGNRIDIGGHRFFSKSDWVMNWWREILPVQPDQSGKVRLGYQNKQHDLVIESNPIFDQDRVMLIRSRLSRIYYLRKFFDYPIRLSWSTFKNLGVLRLAKIGASYGWSKLLPRKPEKSLEDFLYNRFGMELYRTFFKDYTEKVWGVPCHQIAADWGAQRIKGLSIASALWHALSRIARRMTGFESNKVNTSLIEQFLYPKFGPGQMWEEVANRIQEMGGIIKFKHTVNRMTLDHGKVVEVHAWDAENQCEISFSCDFVFSTMPVRDLIRAMGDDVPSHVRLISESLPYRDFITVGLLLKKMRPNTQSRSTSNTDMPPDNWIYIQEKDVKLGRLQIFNNWSPGMVKDKDKVWVGLEYFCNEDDLLWSLSDDALKALGSSELSEIGLIDENDVEDAVVIRMPKAYPAYFGSYSDFDKIREYLDNFQNLFLIGRNGMHRYNNQDHSMLTAKVAVDNIVSGITDKKNIWDINIDDEYHEKK